MLTNREIATLVVLVLLAGFVLTKPAVRVALWRLVVAFLHPKLCLYHAAMAVYVALMITALWLVNFWNLSLAKETVFWVLGAAFPMLMTFHKSEEARANPARWIIAESISAAVLVEFLLGEYVYPIIVELVLVPVSMLVVALQVFARRHERKDTVLPLLNFMLGVVGFVVLARVVVGLIGDWQSLFTLDAMRRITLFPVLSVLYTPFVLSFLLISQYEKVFNRIGFIAKAPRDVVRYAKWRFVRTFGFKRMKLQEFARSNWFEIVQIKSREDVDLLCGRATISTQSANAEPSIS